MHGGIAAVLGIVLLVLTALTWLPGALPLPAARWLMAAVVVLLFPIFISALVRVFLTRADRHAVLMAFRCLPGRVQIGLAAACMSGVAMLIFSTAGEENLQTAEARDGRYFAFDTTARSRGTIEVSLSQYQAVLESDQRSMLAIPGMLFVGAAYFVLAAGELRRADRIPKPS
ncbi:hypothetical protein ACFVDH_27490 [Streptomyces sp. NPDC057674]|uniref:hypothetical protein n=1 Tax=Streptomyces sp. NPDC057674 TaxID=3346203 RepID=UPI00367CA713